MNVVTRLVAIRPQFAHEPFIALDAQNKRTTVRLSNQRYGMSVSDSTFTYRDPRRTSRRPR